MGEFIRLQDCNQTNFRIGTEYSGMYYTEIKDGKKENEWRKTIGTLR